MDTSMEFGAFQAAAVLGQLITDTFDDDDGQHLWNVRRPPIPVQPMNLAGRSPEEYGDWLQAQGYLQQVAGVSEDIRWYLVWPEHEEKCKDCTFKSGGKLHKKCDVVRHLNDDQPWACPFPECMRRQKQRSQAENHIGGFHKEVEYNCLLCGFQCHDSSQLTLHGKKKHKTVLGKKTEVKSEAGRKYQVRRKSVEERQRIAQEAAQEAAQGGDSRHVSAPSSKRRKTNNGSSQPVAMDNGEVNERTEDGPSPAAAMGQQQREQNVEGANDDAFIMNGGEDIAEPQHGPVPAAAVGQQQPENTVQEPSCPPQEPLSDQELRDRLIEEMANDTEFWDSLKQMPEYQNLPQIDTSSWGTHPGYGPAVQPDFAGFPGPGGSSYDEQYAAPGPASAPDDGFPRLTYQPADPFAGPISSGFPDLVSDPFAF